MEQPISLIIHENCNADILNFFDNITVRKKYKRTDGWTLGDFEKAKAGFENGKRIKEIAINLGRSESAVNKFLTRSGIRKKQKPRVGSPKNNSIKKKVAKKQKNIEEKCYEKYTFVFDEVVEYVRSKGYFVQKNNKKNTCYENAPYLVNNKSTSTMKLLLLANKLKIDDGAEIFMIPEIMW